MLGDTGAAVAAIVVALITTIGGIVQAVILVKLTRIGKTVNGTAERSEDTIRLLRQRLADLGAESLDPPKAGPT